MLTPWGDLAVSDAHVHFFSHSFFSRLLQERGDPPEAIQPALSQLGWEAAPLKPEGLARRWVEELDRHGVHRCALIASVHGDEMAVAAALRAYPNRFVGYFMVNPLAPDAENRTRAAFESGLSALCLFPAMHRFPLQDPKVEQLIAIAAQHGKAVFVHCGFLSVGVRKRLGLPSQFDLRFSSPLDVGMLAQRFSKTPFLIPHFGAGLFREALMVADLCPNVYLDTSSSNEWRRYEGLTLRQVFERALQVVGSSRLLFGTDSSWFPRGWNRAVFDQQVEILQQIGISPEDAGRILGGNLNRLLTGSGGS